MGQSPLGFLANPQLSMDLVCLTNYCLSWASHAIPLSIMSCRRHMLDLKANIFFYPYALEASDIHRYTKDE